MDLFKRLSSFLLPAAAMACVGLLVVNGTAGVAQAFGGVVVSPEIDPGAITGAMTLLIGGAMLITSKLSRD